MRSLALALCILLAGVPAGATGPGSCDPPVSNAGRGDATFPDLAWVAHKTGRRIVVAWSTPEETTAAVEYRVDGGALQRVEAPTEADTHAVFISVGQGETVCFRAMAGGAWSEWHPVLARNAWLDHDGEAYHINLVVSATQGVGNIDEIREGLRVYAEHLADATDGHVRSGAILLLVGVPDALVLDVGCGYSHCSRIADVVWTYAERPSSSASAPIDGIRLTNRAIQMNALHHGLVDGATPRESLPDVETPFWSVRHVPSRVDIGFVLAHEMGHYAFGADDLYSDFRPDCFDPTTLISLMSSDRRAREFDDDAARCPPESVDDDYVPTWHAVRARFPLVPDRPAGPVAGPFDAGSRFVVHQIGELPS